MLKATSENHVFFPHENFSVTEAKFKYRKNFCRSAAFSKLTIKAVTADQLAPSVTKHFGEAFLDSEKKRPL